MAKNPLEGFAELSRKLDDLADPKQGAAALREAVRKPMKEVMKVAHRNLAAISPGKRQMHKTYKGRLVGAGFAGRSLNMTVKMSKRKDSASALLGVRKEAFYAVQFFELGTARIPKQPWLVPALESSQDVAIQQAGAVLAARIERIARQRKQSPRARATGRA